MLADHSASHDREGGQSPLSPEVVVPLEASLQAQLYLAQWHLDRGALNEAFCLFAQAARSGHPACLNMLGRAYERGWGTKRNVDEARKLFEGACEGGEGWAFYNLADLYLTGDGVPIDRALACALYVEAARRGIGKAFNMLGLLHEDGYGDVPANIAYAQQYFEAGQRCGDEAASLNLARLLVAAQRRRVTT